MASERSRRRALTVGVGATVLVVVLYLTGGVVSGIRSAANVVVAPFSWTVNEVAQPDRPLFAGAINYSDVVTQNQKLRYELGKAQHAGQRDSGRSSDNSSRSRTAVARAVHRVAAHALLPR